MYAMFFLYIFLFCGVGMLTMGMYCLGAYVYERKFKKSKGSYRDIMKDW